MLTVGAAAVKKPHPECDRSVLEQTADHAAEAAALLKALSHDKRLSILCHLAGRELTVRQINDRVPGSQSVISQHLAVLRRDGLVKTRREAQTIYYSLDDDRAARLIEVLHELFCCAGPVGERTIS